MWVLAVALATGVGTGDLAAALDFGGSTFGVVGGAGGRGGRWEAVRACGVLGAFLSRAGSGGERGRVADLTEDLDG